MGQAKLYDGVADPAGDKLGKSMHGSQIDPPSWESWDSELAKLVNWCTPCFVRWRTAFLHSDDAEVSPSPTSMDVVLSFSRLRAAISLSKIKKKHRLKVSS